MSQSISAQDYLRRAAEAEAIAGLMTRNDHRDEALYQAAEYRRLAAAVEQRKWRPSLDDANIVGE